MILLVEPFSSRIGMYVPALPLPLMEIAGFVHQHLPKTDIRVVSLPLVYGLPLDEQGRTMLFAQFEKVLAEKPPKAIGISCTAISQLTSTLEICQRIKKIRPNTLTFVGGYTPSTYAEEVLKLSDDVDFVLVGEGEWATLAVAESLAESQTIDPGIIPGAIWKNRGELHKSPRSSRFNLADRAPLQTSLYNQGLGVGILPYGFSRGCPFSCYFCMESHIRPKHLKAPKEVVERDLRAIAATGAIDTILATDALFAGEEFLPLLRELGLKIHFEARCDTMKPEILKKHADACGMIAVGLESASYDSLRRMNKVRNREHYHRYIQGAEKIIRAVAEADIPTMVFMIAGYPGDTEADLQESLAFVEQVSQYSGLGGILFRMGECHAYPRTTVYEQAKSLPDVVFDDDGIFGQNTVRRPSANVDFDMIQSYANNVLLHSHLTEKLKTELRKLLPFFRVQPEAFRDPNIPDECFQNGERHSLNISTNSLKAWRNHLIREKAIKTNSWPGERKQRELPI